MLPRVTALVALLGDMGDGVWIEPPFFCDYGPYRRSARPITIGDSAWIGAGSIVLPGVTIGAGAVIGASSLVTTDMPPDSLAFGQPCRVQRAL